MSNPNFLAAQDLIEGRITAKLYPATVKQVSGGSDLQMIESQSFASPACFVLFQGYTTVDDKEQGSSIKVQQKWAVLLAIRNARDVASSDGVRDDANTVMTSLAKWLIGWKPSSSHSALKLTSAPAPTYAPAFGLFALAFITDIYLQAEESP